MMLLTTAALLLATAAHAGPDQAACLPDSDPARALGPAGDACRKALARAKAKGEPKPEKIDQWSSSVANIRKAPCLRLKPFSEDEMLAALAADTSRFASKTESRVIHGIAFKDENPRLLDLFDKLTTYSDYDAKEHPSKQRTFTSSCEKVLCAAAELLGKKVGVQSLFALSRFGYNTSPYTHDEVVAWKPEQLDTVLLGLNSFPPSSLPIEANHPLNHLKKGVGDGHTIANAVVTVFDAWDKLAPEQRIMAIAHEVGHNFAAHAGNVDESKTWLKFSDWHEQPVLTIAGVVRGWEPAKKDATVSLYAQSDPGEDFAESVSRPTASTPTGSRSAAPRNSSCSKSSFSTESTISRKTAARRRRRCPIAWPRPPDKASTPTASRLRRSSRAGSPRRAERRSSRESRPRGPGSATASRAACRRPRPARECASWRLLSSPTPSWPPRSSESGRAFRPQRRPRPDSCARSLMMPGRAWARSCRPSRATRPTGSTRSETRTSPA
jgi:hypothetical protein